MNLAACAVELGLAGEAVAAFEEARRRAPGDARVHRDCGIGLFAIGRVEAAAGALERSVELDPSLAGARLFASRVCAELGDRTRAVHHAREGVLRHPEQASMHLELHRALYDDRDPEPCVAPAARAAELDPEWWLARLALAGARALASGAPIEPLHDAALGGAARALRYAFGHRAPATRYFSSSADLLRHAMSEARPGLTVELGVRHGTSTRVLASAAASRGAEVHGFDSFEGLPEAFYGRAEGAFTTRGEIPELPGNVAVHVGWFEDTLPRWIADRAIAPSLVHVDSDLCSSARTALDHLGPLLAPGTILVFDEYLTNDRWEDDEFKAFQDAAARLRWSYEYVAFNLFTGQAAVRLV